MSPQPATIGSSFPPIALGSALGGSALGPGEVHVWSVVLDQPEPRVAKFNGLLCGEEQQRASRFHFALDQNRFIIGRGSLRMILGHYAGNDPAELSFTTGPHGKPGLAPGLGGRLRGRSMN